MITGAFLNGLDQLYVDFSTPLLSTPSDWTTFTAETLAGQQTPTSIVDTDADTVLLTFANNLVFGGAWYATNEPEDASFNPPFTPNQSGLIE